MKDNKEPLPRYDYVAKEILKNKEILKDFLSTVLKMDPSEIKRIDYLDKELPRLHKEDKGGEVDLNIRLNDELLITIEIQISKKVNFIDRILYYTTKMGNEEIKRVMTI